MLGEHKYLTLTAGLFLTAAQVFGAPSATPRRGRSTTPTVRKSAAAQKITAAPVEKPYVFPPGSMPYYAEIYKRNVSPPDSAATPDSTSANPASDTKETVQVTSVSLDTPSTVVTPDIVGAKDATVDTSTAPIVISSPGFNPDVKITAASQMKMLLTVCVLDADPQLADPENQRLLRLTLFNSNNYAAETLGAKIARQLTPGSPKPDFLLVRDMMNAKAREIGLSDRVYVAYASGDPHVRLIGHREVREDSWITPRDLIKIDLYLSQKHEKTLEDFYRSAGQSPLDNPTNNIIWPLRAKNDPQDASIEVDTKTGTDRYKKHATLMRAVTPDKIIIVYYHHEDGDRRPAIPTSAAILRDVLQQANVDNQDLIGRLNGISNGTIKPNDVGSPWMAAREAQAEARAAKARQAAARKAAMEQAAKNFTSKKASTSKATQNHRPQVRPRARHNVPG